MNIDYEFPNAYIGIWSGIPAVREALPLVKSHIKILMLFHLDFTAMRAPVDIVHMNGDNNEYHRKYR